MKNFDIVYVFSPDEIEERYVYVHDCEQLILPAGMLDILNGYTWNAIHYTAGRITETELDTARKQLYFQIKRLTLGEETKDV